MAKPLDLLAITELAASGAYGGNFALTADSNALLLCAVAYLSDLRLWQGASYSLTDNEIDTIEAMVAQATEDILTEQGASDMDYELIARETSEEDVGYLTISEIDCSEYQTIKLIVSGLKTDNDSTWADHVLVRINNRFVAADYTSYSFFMYNLVEFSTETVGTIAGIQAAYVAASVLSDNGFAGNMEMTFFAPYDSPMKSAMFDGMVGGGTVNKLGRTVGQGTAKIWDAITEIRIAPVLGTTFIIDPEIPADPDALIMSLYGLR